MTSRRLSLIVSTHHLSANDIVSLRHIFILLNSNSINYAAVLFSVHFLNSQWAKSEGWRDTQNSFFSFKIFKWYSKHQVPTNDDKKTPTRSRHQDFNPNLIRNWRTEYCKLQRKNNYRWMVANQVRFTVFTLISAIRHRISPKWNREMKKKKRIRPVSKSMEHISFQWKPPYGVTIYICTWETNSAHLLSHRFKRKKNMNNI